MSAMKRSVMATVIGDVVGSREAGDRVALHAGMRLMLDQANAVLAPSVPLRITVGDEFQGCFETVGGALHATLWLRLYLSPIDLRHGVGWGAVTVLDDEPRVEDGPGWWAARAAIEEVKTQAARSALRHVRTAYRRAEDTEGPDPAAVNAALLCRDQLVGSTSNRSLRLLRGSVDGVSQAELAEQEGISASAVSQRVRNDGLGVVVTADEMLRTVE